MSVDSILARIVGSLPGSLNLDGRQAGRRPTKAGNVRPSTVAQRFDIGAGLSASVSSRVRGDGDVLEWTTQLRNDRDQRSPTLSALRPLDVLLPLSIDQDVTLHWSLGSRCRIDDFQPRELAIDSAPVHLEPNGGRSSDGVLPFFAVGPIDAEGSAIAVGVGWSGQWCSDIQKTPEGVRVSAGLATADLWLEPGEAITLPSILVAVAPDLDRAIGTVRDCLLREILPQGWSDQHPPTPIAHMTMSSFHRTHQTSEELELAAVARAAALGVEAFWIDACWYGTDGDWLANVGSWQVRTSSFPNGLRPISDAAHDAGMRFVWWIEPERARTGSQLAMEHPEFFLPFPEDPTTLLLDLGNPTARSYVLELVSDYIDEFGVDVYRQDFNVAPLPAWLAADAEGRRGLHEIRHIEGLYAFWDALLQRQPGLVIDNCASGGRRIDLETARRSVSLWRSDAADVGGGAEGDAVSLANQVQCAGLSEWIGYHTGPIWGFSSYETRSALATGFVIYCALPDDASASAELRAAVAERQRLRPLMRDRFVRLTPTGSGANACCASQYHDRATGGGFVVVCRRPGGADTEVHVQIAGLEPDQSYRVESRPGYGPGDVEILRGSDLADLQVRLPPAPSAVLIEYGVAPC